MQENEAEKPNEDAVQSENSLKGEESAVQKQILHSASPVQDDKAGVQPETQTAGPSEAVSELPLIQKTAPAKENPLHVKIAIYDGPLDLLLDLIKKNEMDVYDIKVAEITTQYLEYLSRIKELDLEIAGEFIVMAATLIWIKSKMLLPQDSTSDDEEGGDPRAELVRKLLEYQAFKQAAKELGLMEDERGQVFTRQISDYYLSDLDAEDLEIDSFSANLYDLLSAFQSVLAKTSNEAMHEVYEQVVSIEDRMYEIRGRLLEKKRMVFSELFQHGWTRNLLIVTFLAVLEIVRTKTARVMQDKQFGEIYIEQIPESSGLQAAAPAGEEA